MSAVDRLLQRWRIRMAEPFIRTGDRLLDIGCFDGALIQRVLPRISYAAGIDPRATPSENAKVTIFRGVFPAMSPWQPASFDCIAMLATLEHVSDPGDVGRRCFELLSPGGRLV